MSDYPIYYRVVANSGHVSTLQEFDEGDYDQNIWLKGIDGKPLKFESIEAAIQAHSESIHGLIKERNELSDFLRRVAGDEGIWIGPLQGEAIAMQLLAHEYRKPRKA